MAADVRHRYRREYLGLADNHRLGLRKHVEPNTMARGGLDIPIIPQDAH
jgi:hypothetical protein